MKKLLLILLIPMIGFGQQTYVPDNNYDDGTVEKRIVIEQ